MTQEYTERFLKARRAYLEKQYPSLNPEQRQAVLYTEGPLLLLAGAGSGKTTVLINRVAHIIRYGNAAQSEEIPAFITEEHVRWLEDRVLSEALTQDEEEKAEMLCALHPEAPWNIIAITFTNKAAGELRDRLSAMLAEKADGIWAMTFHSACCRILRRYADRLGYGSSFTIYDSADSERVIKDVLKEMDLDEKSFPPRLVLTQISRAKDSMLSPELFAESQEAQKDFRIKKISDIYCAYQNRLRNANAVDFDDIIFLTVHLLQENPDICNYYHNKFHYLLVDEYQDTNHMQYLLTSLLTGSKRNICVVGDDDQSIYKFRGATIRNILDFETQYPSAHIIRLEQNYRSTGMILNAANSVISHNQDRKGKKLWTRNAEGEPVHVLEAYDGSDEAAKITNSIIRLSKKDGFGSCAVLYRTNAQSNAIEYCFKRSGVPYRIIGGTRFFDRSEIKDMLAYLCVINNRSDTLRLRRIINTPARGIGSKTLEQAEEIAEKMNLPLYSVIAGASSYPELQKSSKKLFEFVNLIEDCARQLADMTLSDFYDMLMQKTGYVTMLELKNDMESRGRLENIQELKSSILNYMQNSEAPTLNGFLEEISLYTDIEQYDSNADAVVMMTIHSAKGLEFSHVFLAGMEEGIFPSQRSASDAEELEEDRRLCYVAITRAKKTLHISYARQRLLYGRTTINPPSRFLKELPESCLDRKLNQKHESTSGDRYDFSQEYHENTNYYARQKSPLSGNFRKQTSSGNAAGHASADVSHLYVKGEMVEHSAFGRGMVISVMPMAGDALLEIAFNDCGTKKLLARYAASFLKKL